MTSRLVFRDCADRSIRRSFARTEVAARFLPQFAEVEPQTAAHRPHVARLHVAVDIVREIRGSVLRRHLEQQFVVLGLRPVEVAGDRVGRDRVLEAAPVRVAVDHDLDEGAVDHRHLFFTVAVGEVHILAADDRGFVFQVGGDGPVEGDVGERRLRAPARRRVHAVHETLDALLHFLIGEVVHLDEGSEICVERRERLRARPLVLHDTEEVDHLVAEGGEVAGGRGRDLARNTAQPFADQLFQRPTGAVPGQHRQVVDVDVGFAVGALDLARVDLGEPVVRRDRARVREDQTADRVGHGRVLFHAPVHRLQVTVDDLFIVQDGVLRIADLLALTPIEDIRLRHVGVTRLHEDVLGAVLDRLDLDQPLFDLRLEIRRDLQGKKVDNAPLIIFILRDERLFDGVPDLGQVKINNTAVSFLYAIHKNPLLCRFLR